MLHNCLAHFSQNPQIQTGVYTGGNSVHWLFTTFRVFFFQFMFVLPARYVRMRNFSGKSKQAQVVYNRTPCDANVQLHKTQNKFPIFLSVQIKKLKFLSYIYFF